MKCGCIIKMGLKTKRSKTLSVVKSIIRKFQNAAQVMENPPEYLLIEDDMEICDGNIRVEIEASLGSGTVFDDTYCACFSEFEVRYKCDKCGNNCFPELPQSSEQVSQFVQTAIAQLTDASVERLVEITRKLDEPWSAESNKERIKLLNGRFTDLEFSK